MAVVAEITFDLGFGPNIVRPGKLPRRICFLRMKLDSEPQYRSWSYATMGWRLIHGIPVATARLR